MSRVAALLAGIPERATRSPSGTPLALPRDPAARESRIAFLAQQLSWLTPFSALGPDGQRALGLLATRDKALDRDDEDPEDDLAGR